LDKNVNNPLSFDVTRDISIVKSQLSFDLANSNELRYRIYEIYLVRDWKNRQINLHSYDIHQKKKEDMYNVRV
jgi:hypothetical protein